MSLNRVIRQLGHNLLCLIEDNVHLEVEVSRKELGQLAENGLHGGLAPLGWGEGATPEV